MARIIPNDFIKGITGKVCEHSDYTFSQWSDGNTSASRSVTVNADQTLTAVFTANSSEGGGDENPDGNLD